uniref:F-box domain-containing protein n=1 Tax=Oryza brachyantha TaxID=4533 RepID=J3MPS4_ORYBR
MAMRDAQQQQEEISYAGLSQLPSDVLVAILDKLDLHEAARAAVLSRRSSDYPISTLAVRFFLLRPAAVAGLVDDALAAGKVRAAELTVLAEKDDIHSTVEEEEDLSLENIKLAADSPDFPTIIAACTDLRYLTLDGCRPAEALPSLPVAIRHPRLLQIKIAFCHFSTVVLQWLPELVGFTIWDWVGTPRSRLPLGDLLVTATAITDLRIDFRAENIWLKPEPSPRLRRVLQNLRHLKIHNVHDQCDLSWTLFLLEAAPLLEDLYVELWSHPCLDTIDDDGGEEILPQRQRSDFTWDGGRLAAAFDHRRLTRLTILGFRRDDERAISYVRRVAEVAPGLEEICLREKEPCEDCDDIVDRWPSFPRTDEEKDLMRNRIISSNVVHCNLDIEFIGND